MTSPPRWPRCGVGGEGHPRHECVCLRSVLLRDAYQILNAWRRGSLRLVVSPAILEEYRRVGAALARQFEGVDISPVLELLAANAVLVIAGALPAQVCTDPDDDKFLACAKAAGVQIICSGDKALQKTSGYLGIEVVTPRELLARI